jgi:hypothetical protein
MYMNNNIFFNKITQIINGNVPNRLFSKRSR